MHTKSFCQKCEPNDKCDSVGVSEVALEALLYSWRRKRVESSKLSEVWVDRRNDGR